MDMTQIDEKWLDITPVRRNKRIITAISNTGKYRRFDGTIGNLELRQGVRYCGKKEYCYRMIAEHFLISVRRPDQDQIDHITHTPTEYNVNDIRNLRWCTKAENNNFEEAKYNKSGRKGNLSTSWKGNDVKAGTRYRRALKLYKAGDISEEEMQVYREALNEFRRNKK